MPSRVLAPDMGCRLHGLLGYPPDPWCLCPPGPPHALGAGRMGDMGRDTTRVGKGGEGGRGVLPRGRCRRECRENGAVPSGGGAEGAGRCRGRSSGSGTAPRAVRPPGPLKAAGAGRSGRCRPSRAEPVGPSGCRAASPMRLPGMSQSFLLAPIAECPPGPPGAQVRLAVLGARGVGKSAMIVRFLTKRFIGDYEPNTGSLYSRLVHLDGDHVAVQIQDTPGCIQAQEDCVQVPDSLSRCVKWAEGFLLVYSITDYSSYQSVQPLYQLIRKVHPDARTPIIIVGNKADLLHARQVQAKEGLQLADELGSLFLEISTSEDSQGVCDVFQYLCKEVSKLQHAGSTDRRRSSIIPRPKSPNMQDLKRRFKQALSSKVK
uniref:small monomeric GTPase n=2 Tax=Catharus TaxID=9184 RepID=A0A8C3UMB3_CATUS